MVILKQPIRPVVGNDTSLPTDDDFVPDTFPSLLVDHKLRNASFSCASQSIGNTLRLSGTLTEVSKLIRRDHLNGLASIRDLAKLAVRIIRCYDGRRRGWRGTNVDDKTLTLAEIMKAAIFNRVEE